MILAQTLFCSLIQFYHFSPFYKLTVINSVVRFQFCNKKKTVSLSLDENINWDLIFPTGSFLLNQTLRSLGLEELMQTKEACDCT